MLRAGGLEAVLSPAIGGSLLRLSADGVDVMRPAPDGSGDPLDMASFPLVPYANRIAEGRFVLGGREHRLPRNFGDHPHAIHGHGWQSAWRVTEQAEDSARLVLDHHADDRWPWDFHAEQRVHLTPDTLGMTILLTNRAAEPMPAGLGFHPYFTMDDATTLRFSARGLWLSTPDMLPERMVAADTLGDWSVGERISGETLIDNAYAGWDGRARIERGDGLNLTISATGADFLHLYRPPGEGFFCVEPVSHMPDAINRPDGMDSLSPGATLSLSMTIQTGRGDETLSQRDGIA